MAENFDLSGAVDALKDMLSSENGSQQLQNIMSMFGGDSSAQNSPAMPDIDLDTMFKLQKVMSAMNNGSNSKQTAFLQTLSPLLRPERRAAVDNAVKFLSVGRAIKVFKDIEGV